MSEDHVKWVNDNTGRFRYRPWYSQTYLDRRAEKILFDFLNELYGHVTTPVPTGALTKLIERDARELNLYANLNRAEQGCWVSPISSRPKDRSFELTARCTKTRKA